MEMNAEQWNDTKTMIDTWMNGGKLDKPTTTTLTLFIDNGDKATDDRGRKQALAGLKALCSTMDSTPFTTRKPDPTTVVEALETLRLALTRMWTENDALFTIVEVPHGKTKKAAYESGEEWVQSRLKIYRKRLLDAHGVGNL
jgi:hypothetical protein